MRLTQIGVVEILSEKVKSTAAKQLVVLGYHLRRPFVLHGVAFWGKMPRRDTA